jgi:hypothetical protein
MFEKDESLILRCQLQQDFQFFFKETFRLPHQMKPDNQRPAKRFDKKKNNHL